MFKAPAFLHSLSLRIRTQLHASGGADQALADCLAATATPLWHAQLCAALLTDDNFAHEVAARSYCHGNGFVKIVLLDQGFKLRLHLWLPGAACEENIHDHRWSIASTIIAGELHSEIWQDASCDDAADLIACECRYQAASSTEPARAIALHQAPLKLVRHTLAKAGSAYSLPPATLHRIRNHGQQLVATLMCSSPAIAGHTRLLAGHEGLIPEIEKRFLSVLELRGYLGQFAALNGLFMQTAA